MQQSWMFYYYYYYYYYYHYHYYYYYYYYYYHALCCPLYSYRMVYRRMCTTKLQVTKGIFHGLSRDSLIMNY